MKTKPQSIGYWVTTGLFSAAFLASGAAELTAGPQMVGAMHTLGYPLYFLAILGTWKVLGAVALLVPRFPRLKEWAYAGIFFDLTGASVSHAVSGDPAAKVVAPLFFLALAAASWALRPASRAWKPEAATAPSDRTAGARADATAHA